MSSEHSVGTVEVKGDDVCLEYSVLAVLSVECTVSIDICHCFEAILHEIYFSTDPVLLKVLTRGIVLESSTRQLKLNSL
ncbi:hypothetical protein LWI29_037613 [Acer saccharum]|uniref:Uncharacterized protein n=1 Tax=Acer saccharum TaxID=4024 RepID=A0AA39RJG3_ACESA|nr:hypothetical protein LWI29_037613 [Acer saccharum]